MLEPSQPHQNIFYIIFGHRQTRLSGPMQHLTRTEFEEKREFPEFCPRSGGSGTMSSGWHIAISIWQNLCTRIICIVIYTYITGTQIFTTFFSTFVDLSGGSAYATRRSLAEAMYFFKKLVFWSRSNVLHAHHAHDQPHLRTKKNVRKINIENISRSR